MFVTGRALESMRVSPNAAEESRVGPPRDGDGHRKALWGCECVVTCSEGSGRGGDGRCDSCNSTNEKSRARTRTTVLNARVQHEHNLGNSWLSINSVQQVSSGAPVQVPSHFGKVPLAPFAVSRAVRLCSPER